MLLSIRRIVYVAMFAAMFVVMSAVTLPLGFTPVPITLQNLAVMLAGAFLGARGGFLSIGLVIALTALGLPLLHGQGGLSYILGGTGGFLIAFPLCAAAVGWCTEKLLHAGIHRKNRVLMTVLVFLIFVGCGSLLSYLIGVPWLAAVYDMPLSRAIAAGFLPFIAGDLVKAAAGAVAAAALLPRLSGLWSGTPNPHSAYANTDTDSGRPHAG